jgi:hypothetical protein
MQEFKIMKFSKIQQQLKNKKTKQQQTSQLLSKKINKGLREAAGQGSATCCPPGPMQQGHRYG